MPSETLLALAAAAGNTIVGAATTDTWGTVRRDYARLLSRGNPDQTTVAERRLEETYARLVTATGADLERVRAALVAQWTTRLADMLEENPDVERDLRALVEEVTAQLPATALSAADHSVAAGRDVNISASGGGIAAGVIHGNVAPPGPYPEAR